MSAALARAWRARWAHAARTGSPDDAPAAPGARSGEERARGNAPRT